MTKYLSLGLHCLIAIGIVLSLLLFFLAENGRVNSFATYLVALALIPVMLFPSSKNRLRELPRGVLLLTVSVLQYLAISSWWSELGSFQLFLKFQGYAVLILSFLLGLAISVRQYKHFLVTLAALTIAAASVSASYSIYLHFALPDYQPLAEQRLYGLGRLSNPVISAASYGFAALLGFWLLFRQQDRVQLLMLLIALCLLGFVILLSGTRTVWLALGFGIGAGVAFWRREFGLLGFACLLIVVGIVALFALGWDDITSRGFSFRPEIWSEFVSRTLATQPILGAGSGSRSYWLTPEMDFKHPHSVFVSVFFFGGIVGLALFIGLLIACFSHLKRTSSGEAKVLCAMLLSYGIVFSTFDGDNILTKIDYLWWLIWVPVGVCLSLERHS